MAITTNQITITTMEGWYSGATPPLNPLIGDLWLDTTSNEIKKYDGTNWIKQADTQGPQGPKGDSMVSRVAYWIKSSTKPEPPDSETGNMKGWTKGSEPPESALAGILPSDKFWRIYKETYSNGENEYSKYSEVELIGSYEVLNGLVQFRKGVTTTENIGGQDVTVIDGGKIKTGSIDAKKIHVEDLEALKATIGGFHIGKNSIYSGNKKTIDSTERGIYFDSNGQSYLGDDKNFIRFYRSDKDNYKLQISADSLTFGSGVSVEKAFEDIKGDIQNAQGTADAAKEFTDNAKNNYGYQYKVEIEVGGDPNTYYPVMIFGPDAGNDLMREILIKRRYSDKAPAEWNGHPSYHGINLTCKIKTLFGGWGGAQYDWQIHEILEDYGHAFAGCKIDGSGMMFFIFLRGGGAAYTLCSDMPMDGVFPPNFNPTADYGPSIWYNGDLVARWNGDSRPFYAPQPRTYTEDVIKEIHDRTYIQVATDAYKNANTAQNTATEAAKTADNYISADSTRVMISENKGATKETPSNATKNNVLITKNDVQIRNGQEVVASYGKSAIIGKNKSDNIQIKDNGFSINHDGNEMFVVKQEDEENNYINEIMKATYEASTDTYSLESSYKAYYPNKNPILYVIYRSKPYGLVSRKETIQYGDTKLPCTVSITEEGKYLVQFKKTDWDKSWRDMDPEIEMDYYAAGGGAMVTIGTRIDHGLANDGSWSLTVGSANTAGSRSIAVGENNVARDNSVAIGSMCYARNDAIAVGSHAIATSYNSAAIGDHVSTDNMNQLVVGQYNRQTPYGTQFVVGCGVNSETANAAAITASGDIKLKGTVYIGCEKDSTGGKSIIDLIYPVGSIYMSVNSADPGTLFGGTWERIQDTFLLASGSTYGAGTTGGSADAVVVSHTHAQTAHSHGFADGDKVWTTASGSTEPGNQISGSGKYYAATAKKDYAWRTRTTSETPGIKSTGESGTGKNMPPYLAVYVWKRIS